MSNVSVRTSSLYSTLSSREKRRMRSPKVPNSKDFMPLTGQKLRNLRVYKPEKPFVRNDMLAPKGDIRWHFAEEMVRLLGFDPGEGLPGRSKYDPKQLYEKVAAYDGVGVFNVDGERMRRAFNLVHANYTRYLRQPLQPLDLSVTPTYIKKNTAAGYPFKPGTKKGDVLDEALENALALVWGTKQPNPCTAFCRTQGRKQLEDPGKVRLIWGYPLEMLLLEAQFAVPVLEYVQQYVPSVAMGERKLQLATRLDHLRDYTCVFNGDWKSFDSSVPTEVISLAFRIVESLFEREDDDGPTGWCFANDGSWTGEHNWELVKRYFATCAVLMPDGSIVKRRRKGIPSGSFFTSIIGSICNELLITYLFLGQDVKWEGLYLGDDTISGLNKRVDTNMLIADAAECFGMRLVCNKLNYGSEVQFLGHYWENARPKRDIKDTYQRLAFPERWNTNVKCIDLIASLYGDNVLLWDDLPDKLKVRFHSWWGIDHAAFAAWEKLGPKSGSAPSQRSETLTL